MTKQLHNKSWYERNPGKTLFCIIALIVFLLFALSEIFLSFMANNSNYCETERGVFKYKKNTKFTNENESGEHIEFKSDKYGFRNENSIYTSNLTKIIVLGDSFLMNPNIRYEDSLCELLNVNSRKYVFINGGMRGYSNFQMLKALIYLIDEGFIPESVLCFVYLGNDLRDNYRSYDEIMELDVETCSEITHAKNIEKNKKILAQCLLGMIKKFAKKSKFITWLYGKLPYFKPDKYTSYFYGELELYKKRPNSVYYSKAIQATDHVFKSFRNVSNIYKFDILFILIPSKAQVYQEFKLIDRYHSTKEADKEILDIIKTGYNFDNIREIYGTLIDKYEFRYIDLTDIFREEIRKGIKVFHSIDLHWNKKGQRVASEILKKEIPEIF